VNHPKAKQAIDNSRKGVPGKNGIKTPTIPMTKLAVPIATSVPFQISFNIFVFHLLTLIIDYRLPTLNRALA